MTITRAKFFLIPYIYILAHSNHLNNCYSSYGGSEGGVPTPPRVSLVGTNVNKHRYDDFFSFINMGLMVRRQIPSKSLTIYCHGSTFLITIKKIKNRQVPTLGCNGKIDQYTTPKFFSQGILFPCNLEQSNLPVFCHSAFHFFTPYLITMIKFKYRQVPTLGCNGKINQYTTPKFFSLWILFSCTLEQSNLPVICQRAFYFFIPSYMINFFSNNLPCFNFFNNLLTNFNSYNGRMCFLNHLMNGNSLSKKNHFFSLFFRISYHILIFLIT